MQKLLQKFKNLPFVKKLVLSYIMISIIPIMFLGFYSYFQSKSLLKEQAMRGLEETADTMTLSLNSKIERYNTIVKFIVFNSGIQKIVDMEYEDLVILSEELRNYLDPHFRMIKNFNNEINQLTIYLNNKPDYGDYIQSYDQMEKNFWYQDVNIKDIKATEWYFDKGELFVLRNFPNLDILKDRAYLYMKLNKKFFFDELSTSVANNNGIIITDYKNKIIFQKHSPILKDEEFRPEEVVSKKQGTTNINGKEYMVIQKKIRDAEWTLYYYVPVKAIPINASNIIYATLLAVFTCLLILMIIILLFSRTLIKPIKYLYNKMKLVEEGNFNIIVSSQYKDEIGVLTNGFGHMVKKTNQLIQEVTQNKIIQKEAEFKALQAQINPHFLYNSLSIIHWKSLQSDVPEISSIALTLSKFYRTALNKGENVITIEDEVDNIKSYIQMQLLMHDYSFDVEYEIDENIYQFNMINLILQPIVENAIEHGIDQKREGRGRLRVVAKETINSIEFMIEDNGPGLPKGKEKEILNTDSSGYGMKNVNDRIKLFFGDVYGLQIFSQLGKGTTVKIITSKFIDSNTF